MNDSTDIRRRARSTILELERQPAPILVVLDNVSEWTAGHRPDPLPDGTHIGYLVTTRQQRLGGTAFAHVPLDVLPPDAARALLERTADRGRLSGAEPLLAHLEGHALGLELAGAYLQRYRQQSPADYLAKMQAGDAARGEQRVIHAVRYNATVDAALNTVWDRLDEVTRRAWMIAAPFSDAPATVQLAKAAGLEEDALADLEALHLVHYEHDDAAARFDRWMMHRLVRSFGRRTGDDEARRIAERRFLMACVGESKATDAALGFRRYQRDQPHFDRATAAHSVAFSAPGHHAQLLGRIAGARRRLGDFQAARALYTQAPRPRPCDLRRWPPRGRSPAQ